MASYSVATTLVPSLTISASQSLAPKSARTTKLFCTFPLPSFSSKNSLKTLRSSVSSRRVSAAPEVLDSVETVDPPAEILDGTDAETSEMPPKNKIRIKLRSYLVPLIEDSCKQILTAATTTNAKTMGPVPLPTRTRKYCVLKSPHVNKDARFHFEIRTHQRMIDILYPTAQTIDSLMQLDLPLGVDVEIKL